MFVFKSGYFFCRAKIPVLPQISVYFLLGNLKFDGFQIYFCTQRLIFIIGNGGHKIKNNSHTQHKKNKNKMIKKGVFFKEKETGIFLQSEILTTKQESEFVNCTGCGGVSCDFMSGRSFTILMNFSLSSIKISLVYYGMAIGEVGYVVNFCLSLGSRSVFNIIIN